MSFLHLRLFSGPQRPGAPGPRLNRSVDWLPGPRGHSRGFHSLGAQIPLLLAPLLASLQEVRRFIKQRTPSDALQTISAEDPGLYSEQKEGSFRCPGRDWGGCWERRGRGKEGTKGRGLGAGVDGFGVKALQLPSCFSEMRYLICRVGVTVPPSEVVERVQ